ncbi:DUF6502 family protein [Piscinibacter sp.]|uniref:DUF6502 family protein n=1 Tax=Piscinibacter sp. TaxID=1903157 RepID=UPI00355A48B0
MKQHDDPARADGLDPKQVALLDALRRVLEPLAGLAVAKGLPYAAVDSIVKEAFVAAAHAAHPGLPEHRRVSRISASTGINRREVTRLTQEAAAPRAAPRSLATEVFARWRSSPDYRGKNGRPLVLRRQGPAPSFETLAQSVTRDKHPRSLLEELVRLQLVTVDSKSDKVSLAREAFVPRGDEARMLGFLGANVGDHLNAAVANVLSDGTRHFEQAIFADELSAPSLAAVHKLVSAQWQVLLKATVPALEQLIEADSATQRTRDQRVRIGLYSYAGSMAAAATDPKPDPDSTPSER